MTVESEEEFDSLTFERILESKNIPQDLKSALTNLRNQGEIDVFTITSKIDQKSLSYTEKGNLITGSKILIERKADSEFHFIPERQKPEAPNPSPSTSNK